MNLHRWLPAAATALAFFVTGCDSGGWIVTPSGLKYQELAVGDGAAAKSGDYVEVLYTGTLDNGKQFDSAQNRSDPPEFLLGRGQVIKGWDEGLIGMKVGGKRKLIVPPDLGYGKLGKPPQIPANSTLVFVVELLGVGDQSRRKGTEDTAEKNAVTKEEEIKTGKESDGLTEADKGKKLATTSTGLKYVELNKGKGREARNGSHVEVHYVGTLLNGKQFDSSRDRDSPFTFQLGSGSVIRGWDQGIAGMKIGGRRKLIIPPELGYGSQGKGQIPPNSTLVFDVELLSVR